MNTRHDCRKEQILDIIKANCNFFRESPLYDNFKPRPILLHTKSSRPSMHSVKKFPSPCRFFQIFYHLEKIRCHSIPSSKPQLWNNYTPLKIRNQEVLRNACIPVRDIHHSQGDYRSLVSSFLSFFSFLFFSFFFLSFFPKSIYKARRALLTPCTRWRRGISREAGVGSGDRAVGARRG